MQQKQSLEAFSKKQQHIYHKKALLEGVIAIIPGVIFIAVALMSAGAPAESFSPSRFQVVMKLFPFILVAYFLFLGYVVYDINEKLTRK